MNILLIEDEPLAARQLKEMISDLRPMACFDAVIDNVEDAANYLKSGARVDLMFMDIHLSDGLAFEVFRSIDADIPVVFTTAYDQYAIKAFEINSIDYLLKPVAKEMVARALSKFERQSGKASALNEEQVRSLQRILTAKPTYKENFLVSFKDKLIPVPSKDFVQFQVRNGVVFGTTNERSSYILEERSLEDIADVVDPGLFFRANRQFLINRMAIKEIARYFNQKLLVTLRLPGLQPVVISRDKAVEFKEWMRS